MSTKPKSITFTEEQLQPLRALLREQISPVGTTGEMCLSCGSKTAINQGLKDEPVLHDYECSYIRTVFALANRDIEEVFSRP